METAGRPVHYQRLTCRACGSDRLHAFLSLGPTPLANAFLTSPAQFADEPSFPLDVYFCEECSLMQLCDVIDPEVLFRNYIYVTGTSDTIAAHNDRYARTVVELLGLGSRDLVVEVASNDGSLLKRFQPYGVRTLGVEPAVNIAKMACDAGIETVNEFFNAAIAPQIRERYGAAQVVIGNNVLAHVDETQDFLRGCKALLTEDGLVVIEVPYLRELLDRLEYDTIYHEHICYFSVTTLLRLCESVGLVMVRVDHVPVHGGSLRMYAGQAEHYREHAPQVLAKADAERAAGMTNRQRYDRFARDVQRNRQDLRHLLEAQSSAGRRLAGYGAPAKGNTLLNFCQISTDLIPYTVDKSPLKVGLYTPGMHIPVLPVSALVENQPDAVLILAWNFAEEIMRQQSTYAARGGRFIVPIPEPKVVGEG